MMISAVSLIGDITQICRYVSQNESVILIFEFWRETNERFTCFAIAEISVELYK